MMKHPAGFLFLLCVVVLVCAGCSKADNAVSYSGAGMAKMALADEFAREESQAMPSTVPEASGAGRDVSAQENAIQSRKLVKRANISLRVDDPSAMEKPLGELMGKYGAWPASTGVYENSRDYSIRVPSLAYEDMLADLAGLGRVLRRTENAEDVTLRYYDLEGRLATKRELLRTYQGYLGKARNIEEIMTVESRIADLQQEIDWTGTQLRNLSSLVDYSTIDLEISGPPSAFSYAKPTLGEKMRELFGSFGDVASSALVVITGFVIFGVPAILIIILLFWIFFGRIGLIKKLWRLARGNFK